MDALQALEVLQIFAGRLLFDGVFAYEKSGLGKTGFACAVANITQTVTKPQAVSFL